MPLQFFAFFLSSQSARQSAGGENRYLAVRDGAGQIVCSWADEHQRAWRPAWQPRTGAGHQPDGKYAVCSLLCGGL